MELPTLEGGDPDLLRVRRKFALKQIKSNCLSQIAWVRFSYLFRSSLGDLLFSRLFPFRFRVVSLEFGRLLVAVLDLFCILFLAWDLRDMR